jgi:hypothetical protein
MTDQQVATRTQKRTNYTGFMVMVDMRLVRPPVIRTADGTNATLPFHQSVVALSGQTVPSEAAVFVVLLDPIWVLRASPARELCHAFGMSLLPSLRASYIANPTLVKLAGLEGFFSSLTALAASRHASILVDTAFLGRLSESADPPRS